MIPRQKYVEKSVFLLPALSLLIGKQLLKLLPNGVKVAIFVAKCTIIIAFFIKSIYQFFSHFCVFYRSELW